LDTTSSVTCFLTIYQVTQDKTGDERINKARIRGFEFIKTWQTDSGLWKDDTFHLQGIETTTAHLMQYTLVPAYFMDKIEYEEKCVCKWPTPSWTNRPTMEVGIMKTLTTPWTLAGI
jgi:hypothetical protein